MAQVGWSSAALRQLIDIRAYIAQFDPVAADRMASRLHDLGESLADFPRRGRPARHGLRELATVPPFVLSYDVEDERVTILDIRHGARQPPG